MEVDGNQFILMKQNFEHKIGLGTVQFGLDYGISNEKGRPSLEEVQRILKVAYDRGLDVLDTAAGYGESEMVLGKCLKGFPLKAFKIITKFKHCSTESELREQFAQSVKRLNVDEVYGLMAHRPSELVEFPEVWSGLLALKSEGIVVKVGYSLNTLNEFQQLEEMHEIMGYPDVVQVPFNYFDTRFVETLKKLKSKGCEIHCRSVFLQGLFFTSTEKLSAHFDSIKIEIQRLQDEFGKGLSGALLNYALEKEFIDRVIIGVQSAEQLSENIDELKAFKFGKRKLLDCKETFTEEIFVPSNWKK